jgi:hypothetical protein
MAEDSGYMLEPLREEADFTSTAGGNSANRRRSWRWRLPLNRRRPQSLRRLEHEWSLASELDAAWAAQP